MRAEEPFVNAHAYNFKKGARKQSTSYHKRRSSIDLRDSELHSSKKKQGCQIRKVKISARHFVVRTARQSIS